MDHKDVVMARRIAQAVREQGGRVFYVGGLVRDKLMGMDNKDVDIEVHGVTPQTLENILDSLGSRNEMGASFGIYGLRHYDLDISMPHRRGAPGRNRQPALGAEPFIGTEQAALRRDLTINAMMEDVLTGELIDHFGGREDLRQGVIRHVNDETFAEDPLRVLRAAQFAARFGFRVAEETVCLCRTLDVSSLAEERIFEELKKVLLKAPKPSLFFEVLRQMEQLHTWFPEVEQLVGIEQEPAFHPEGDVWNHTMMVLDQAAIQREAAEYPLGLMLAALCHDFGKAETTQLIDGRIRAFGHETAGIPLTERFLQRMTKEVRIGKYVTNMVELHMRPNLMAAQCSGQKAFNHLFDRSLSPGDLLLLAKADALGQGRMQNYSSREAFLRERLTAFREMMERPYVMGADLIALGFKPGKDFAEALAYGHKLRLAGIPKEEALRQTAAYLRKIRLT